MDCYFIISVTDLYLCALIAPSQLASLHVTATFTLRASFSRHFTRTFPRYTISPSTYESHSLGNGLDGLAQLLVSILLSHWQINNRLLRDTDVSSRLQHLRDQSTHGITTPDLCPNFLVFYTSSCSLQTAHNKQRCASQRPHYSPPRWS